MTISIVYYLVLDNSEAHKVATWPFPKGKHYNPSCLPVQEPGSRNLKLQHGQRIKTDRRWMEQDRSPLRTRIHELNPASP